MENNTHTHMEYVCKLHTLQCLYSRKYKLWIPWQNFVSHFCASLSMNDIENIIYSALWYLNSMVHAWYFSWHNSFACGSNFNAECVLTKSLKWYNLWTQIKFVILITKASRLFCEHKWCLKIVQTKLLRLCSCNLAHSKYSPVLLHTVHVL